MTIKELVIEIVRGAVISLSTFILITVALMKAEAVIGSGFTVFNVLVYLLLIGAVIASAVLLYGRAERYQKYRRDKFDDRVFGVAILVLVIIWGMPLLMRWWQSEPHPSISLGQWMLLSLPPPGVHPDWFIPSISAALITMVCFLLLRDKGAALEAEVQRKKLQQEVKREKTATKLNEQLTSANELASSHEYQASLWKTSAESNKQQLGRAQSAYDSGQSKVQTLTQANQAAATQIEELTAAWNQEQQQVRRERSEKATLVKQIQMLREELARERQAQRAATPAQAAPADAVLGQLGQRLASQGVTGAAITSPSAPRPLTTGAARPSPSAALPSPADGLLERWIGVENEEKWELALLRRRGELAWQLRKDGIEQTITSDQQAVLRYLYQLNGVPTAPAALRDNIQQITGAAVSYDNIKKILGRMREHGLVSYTEGKGYFLVRHNPLQ